MARSRYLWVSLPIIAFSATVTIYLLLFPKLSFFEPWSLSGERGGSLFASTEPHESLLGASDVLIALHPDLHVRRPPQTLHLEWNITKGERRPDGVAKEVYLINGQFPGPTVEARSGDEVVIHIWNFLPDDEGTAMHWHGLDVDNEMDGAVGLTQCSISAGRSFTYRLKIREYEAGTFWYHSHSETQRADGLYGAFVVHNPAEAATEDQIPSDSEQVLMVGDWYHRSAFETLEYYTDWKHWKIEPVGDSMLLNGHGKYNCSMAVPARPVNCKEVEVPKFSFSGRRTRLRVVNTGAMSGFTISVTGYRIWLLSVDGDGSVNSSAPASAVGIVYPGERVDVLVERLEGSEEEPSITISFDPESRRFPNLALTPIQSFPLLSAQSPDAGKSPSDTKSSELSLIDLQSVSGAQLPPDTLLYHADSTLVLYTTISYLAQYENRPKGFINRTSWTHPPSTSSPLLALDRADWPTAPFIPAIEQSQWVDIVLNNLDDKAHPFHLHGHSFFVVGYHKTTRAGAYEAWNPFDATSKPAGGEMNLINPLKKDTVAVPSMGYVVLRLKAENAGIWLFHCHVTWHQAVGMGMAFQVGGGDTDVRVKDVVMDSCR